MADEPNVISVVSEDEPAIPAPPYSRLERLLVRIIELLDTSSTDNTSEADNTSEQGG